METAKGKTRDEIINKLADHIDSFEKYSHPHSHFMAEMAVRLARRFGLAQPDVHATSEAALLHDIGLYAMTPAYHSSSGLLSFEERMDLWRHPIIGEQQMAKRDAPRHAQLLVRWHHEWWNGSGYPDRLAFEDIPIGARILRAVELYTALISDRPYRAALSSDEAVEVLKSSAGVECDPYVVKALLALLEELRAETTVSEPQRMDAASGSIAEEQNTTVDRSYIGRDSEPRADAEAESRAFSFDQSPPPLSKPEETSHEPHSDTPSLFPVPNQNPRPAPAPALPPLDLLKSHAGARDRIQRESGKWRGWTASRYNSKSLLGFEVSVLRQLEFRSVAIPFCGWAQLDWYLKAWGKQIHSNDPRAWAAAASRAMVEARSPLSESNILRLLEDIYVPGTKLTNPHLRRWFGETDSWWMDNLRRNINEMEDEMLRAQAFVLGFQTGDYAQSFNEETQDLRRPLTTIFWRLAGRSTSGQPGNPLNRSYNQKAEEFIYGTRVDLLYLNLPSAHTESSGSEARSQWRESWVRGTAEYSTDDFFKLTTLPQSKHTYLLMVDRLLRTAAHVKTWAIGYQEVGLASARDISDLIKEHRPVRATYSKDLAEVAGGLRNYIIVADRP